MFALSIRSREFRQRPNVRLELNSSATVMRLFRVLKTETTEDAKPRPEAATHVKNGVFNHLKLMPIVWVDLHTPLLKVSEIIISAEIQVIIMKFQLCGATQPIQPRDLITVILYQEAKAHASGEEDVR
jgi:hypothetical protein